MHIQNKVALVTGASKGLGLAITKALLQAGATVAGWSRSVPEGFTHDHFHYIKADLTKELSVQQAYEQTVSEVGEDIPILINNAGIGYQAALEDMPADRWRYLFDLNVHGIFYVSRLIIPRMKANQEGHIINISSGAGTNGIAKMSCYCGTKHAVVGITHSLHQELRNFGVKATCLSPGSIDTGFSSSKKNKLQPKDMAASVIHMLQCPQNFHYTDVQVRPLQP